MGLIKKKTAARGTEGGIKFICDVCSADITSTVRIRCAHPACNEYDLCVPCFAEGKSSRDHHPPTHPYSVIEQHSIPIYSEDWGADEELLLLEGAETYGLGSWADIADHIGGYRTKDEVRDHYIRTYIESSKFPLPERASPKNTRLTQEVPREVFQARKKRRIEERKEAAKNAPPATPKQKPTASVPACHEVQGYMPGRLEFETEYFNEAEEAVQHMQFDPGDGINPRTGELEPEVELKMKIMEIYNNRLTARIERKKLIFEHKLLEYRKNAAMDKKRTKEERDLFNKVKAFARAMNHKDFSDFAQTLEYELNLRQAIAQLQEWRNMGIGDLKTGEKYEHEKQQRAARQAPTGQFDRFATANRIAKPAPPAETQSVTSELTAPELPSRLQNGMYTPPPSSSVSSYSNGITTGTDGDRILTNGSTTNGILTPARSTTTNTTNINHNKPKFPLLPLPSTTTAPLKFTDENTPDLHLLSADEREVCSALRLMPKAYTVLKETFLRESMRHGGVLKRKAAKEICRIEAGKGVRLWEFFVWNGWIGRA